MYLLAFDWLKIQRRWCRLSGCAWSSQCLVGLKVLAILSQAIAWLMPAKAMQNLYAGEDNSLSIATV